MIIQCIMIIIAHIHVHVGRSGSYAPDVGISEKKIREIIMITYPRELNPLKISRYVIFLVWY
jgi:hypothetical protein